MKRDKKYIVRCIGKVAEQSSPQGFKNLVGFRLFNNPNYDVTDEMEVGTFYSPKHDETLLFIYFIDEDHIHVYTKISPIFKIWVKALGCKYHKEYYYPKLKKVIRENRDKMRFIELREDFSIRVKSIKERNKSV